MTATLASSRTDAITLKGSAELVTEFFNYGINNILYQRGVYPADTFKREVCYGLPMVLTDNKDLQEYIENVLKQVQEWLMERTVQKIVLVITSIESKEDIERWQFDIQCDKSVSKDSKPKEKPLKEIRKEIQEVIRQITASVTFLPLLDEPCAFEVLVYTDKDQSVPDGWEDSHPHFIANSQEVRLKSINTLIHKVDTMVAYRIET